MKTYEATLADFIKDFRLEVPGIGVCFKARVLFSTASFSREFICEIHIITMALTKQSVLYLMNGELAENGIPDTFSFDADAFVYEKNTSLVVRDYDLLRGKFNLSISPISGSQHSIPQLPLGNADNPVS